jgi:DNA-binding SARP family transcriptional activator
LGGWLPTASHVSLCTDLEAARVTADETLWEVELRLGHHQLVVDEMAQAAALNPSRERLVGLAMTALHRSGRTAEALRHFENSRRWLATELGVDPSAELRELHLAMLSGNAVTGLPGAAHYLPLRAPGSAWPS